MRNKRSHMPAGTVPHSMRFLEVLIQGAFNFRQMSNKQWILGHTILNLSQYYNTVLGSNCALFEIVFYRRNKFYRWCRPWSITSYWSAKIEFFRENARYLLES